jgi:hypothetical protein
MHEDPAFAEVAPEPPDEPGTTLAFLDHYAPLVDVLG